MIQGKELLLGALLALPVAGLAQTDLEERHPGAEAFIEEMVAEHDFDADRLRELFADAERKQSIIDAMTRPAEAKPWNEYRKIFMTAQRIIGGGMFIEMNDLLLEEVECEFGVPKEIVAAIIGVETRYGQITGNYRVLDALSTLAFHYPPRAAFFRKELKQYLLLGRDENLDVQTVLGSYAGAMGMGQFIPSSYRAYAVDFDDDGQRDLWRSPRDAIASVANYFKAHQWQAGEPVVVPAVRSEGARELDKLPLKPAHTVAEIRQWGYQPTVPMDDERLATVVELDGDEGPEYWIAFHNFYVISRYNRSALYSMAVYQLSEAIETARAAVETAP